MASIHETTHLASFNIFRPVLRWLSRLHQGLVRKNVLLPLKCTVASLQFLGHLGHCTKSDTQRPTPKKHVAPTGVKTNMMCDDMWSLALIYLHTYSCWSECPYPDTAAPHDMKWYSRQLQLSLWPDTCGTAVSLLKTRLCHYLPDYFMIAL